ncbi:MAG: hypothetical protein PHH06_04115 [Candidatus Gracilibacteria bacterium]|nr:hypothetical protein [Candidatus Gracilibacteria bacterium]
MSRIVKVVITTLIFVISYFNLNNIASAQDGADKYFIVTAYYSPLPDQKHYTTGSYGGDLKLNGKGHTTASGKPVEVGLLAGPSNYPYGTKIYFDGFGVGVVEDRGGAIVKAGVSGYEHDRIDIWMGYGDEGLMRAKKWGKRVLKGEIVNPSSEVTLRFADNVMNGYEDLGVVGPESSTEEIIKLQELFTRLGYYKEEIDGSYEKIKDELLTFQKQNKIINSESDWGAGYFGDKTKLALIKKCCPNPLVEEDIKPEITEIDEKVKIIMDYGELTLKPESNIEDIKKVQELFTKLELYSGVIDGNYETIKDSLISFQKEVGLVDHEDDWGAGYLGDKTKAMLITYFEDKANRREIAYNLKQSEIEKLKTITRKISIYLKQKAKGNKTKEIVLKNNFIEQIDTLKDKTSNTKLKNRLLYIKENI